MRAAIHKKKEEHRRIVSFNFSDLKETQAEALVECVIVQRNASGGFAELGLRLPSHVREGTTFPLQAHTRDRP